MGDRGKKEETVSGLNGNDRHTTFVEEEQRREKQEGQM